MTPSQIVATLQAIPTLNADAATAWLEGFSDPSADISDVEDMAGIAEIWLPKLAELAGPYGELLTLLIPSIEFAIAHPGTGQNIGPSEGGKIGAGR